jgi:hypothetical protein
MQQSLLTLETQRGSSVLARTCNFVQVESVGGEGFEPQADCRGFRGVGNEAAQKAAHGWRGGVGEAGALGRHEARGGWGGVRAGWLRPRAHGATWRRRGRATRGQQAGRARGHGSSLARAHALGPTEELTGAIEFVSGGCHRCHRYRNWRRRSRDRPLGLFNGP